MTTFYGGGLTVNPMTGAREHRYIDVCVRRAAVEVLLALLKEKGLLSDEQRAVTAVGADVANAFNNFSPAEIEAASIGTVGELLYLSRAPYVSAEEEAKEQKGERLKAVLRCFCGNPTIPGHIHGPDVPCPAIEPPAVEPKNILATVYGNGTEGSFNAPVASFVRSNAQPTRSAEIEPASETDGPEQGR